MDAFFCARDGGEEELFREGGRLRWQKDGDVVEFASLTFVDGECKGFFVRGKHQSR